jgi:hypothetical protein
MLGAVMLSVIMLGVVMLGVIMLSVLAPETQLFFPFFLEAKVKQVKNYIESNLSLQDKTWAEFSTLDGSVLVYAM